VSRAPEAAGAAAHPPVISGTCDSRFAGVREAFAANFRNDREVGAALAISADGRLVVDLWGGRADPVTGRAWQADTLVGVASVTKGITALAALHLVERGLLELDAPVARYWPEFARAGKADITVRHLRTPRRAAGDGPRPAGRPSPTGAPASARWRHKRLAAGRRHGYRDDVRHAGRRGHSTSPA
jgi:CubicO group peptidase (beta-lactamase class C family)